jgi:hypothetical protein
MLQGNTCRQKKDEINRQDDTPPDRPRSALIPFLLFILRLLGVTMPHPNLNAFFPIAAIISGHLWWRPVDSSKIQTCPSNTAWKGFFFGH